MKQAILITAIACASTLAATCSRGPTVGVGQNQSGEIVRAYAPDCTGAERWPTMIAPAHLKEAGIPDIHQLDLQKTTIIRLASEQIGKDVFRQVHHVTFKERSGGTIEVIAVNKASSEKCSISDGDVFVV